MRSWPGSGFVFMKVGTHAREELGTSSRASGRGPRMKAYGPWAMGRNTCHPFIIIVHGFVRARLREEGRRHLLCMQPMTSRHFAAPPGRGSSPKTALHGCPCHKEINVLGVACHAMAIDELREEEFDLSLGNTQGGCRDELGPSWRQVHRRQGSTRVASEVAGRTSLMPERRSPLSGSDWWRDSSTPIAVPVRSSPATAPGHAGHFAAGHRCSC